jgi:hypothetical protein
MAEWANALLVRPWRSPGAPQHQQPQRRHTHKSYHPRPPTDLTWCCSRHALCPLSNLALALAVAALSLLSLLPVCTAAALHHAARECLPIPPTAALTCLPALGAPASPSR